MKVKPKYLLLLACLVWLISLLVAAIGIANTMMMSIYERTKEIGVFKVLGCRLSWIRNIFLCEAALIGFICGLGGCVLSLLVSYGVNTFMASTGQLAAIGMLGNRLMLIPLWLVLIGMVFATLIGMVSGILPARRAMRLSALEAIRTQ